MYSPNQPPIPWRLDHDMSKYDTHPEYTADHFTVDNWPRNGFIDDFHAYTLGFETTNLITFWTAVHGISATLKRSIKMHFGDGLFPNFYVIIVAPPAVCHKSTALARFDKVENVMWDSIPNEAVRATEKPVPVRGKATPEQLFEAMKNRTATTEDHGEIEGDANLIMRISELSVFISKAQYNQTLIDRITDFYDCKDEDTDGTIARGGQKISRIFATLFGCTTPDAFKNSIPETAFGGGFMSRCTVVQEEATTRVIPVPFYPSEGPERQELADRLRWIYQFKRGTYKLTEEAYDAYKEWYRVDAIDKRNKIKEKRTDHRDGRKSDIILKLATILAVQRYDLVKEITLEDFETARKIIEYTNRTSLNLVEDVNIETQENGKFFKFQRIIREASPRGISKTQLARVHGFRTGEIEQFLVELTTRGEYVEGEGSSTRSKLIAFKEAQ